MSEIGAAVRWENVQADLRDQANARFSSARIQELDRDELRGLQALLGFGDSLGSWITPEEWVAEGSSRSPERLVIDLKRRLGFAGCPTDMIDAAEVQITRIGVLMAMYPCGSRGTRYLKPNTIIQCLLTGAPVVIAGAYSVKRFEGRLPIDFDLKDWPNLSSKAAVISARTFVDRIRLLHDRGMWDDVFSTRDAVGEYDSLKGQTADEPSGRARVWLPLADDYIAAASSRALWMMRDLAPNVIALARRFVTIRNDNPISSSQSQETSVQIRRRRLRAKAIANHLWVDHRGQSIDAPPFPLLLQTKGRQGTTEWPPTRGGEVAMLLGRIQMAHLWIVLISVGSRISESLSLKQGCIVHSRGGEEFANGLTFKLTQLVEGKQRDWPLPERALEALRQQEVVAKLIGELGQLSADADMESDNLPASDDLWRRPGTGKAFTSDVRYQLQETLKALGLSAEPDDLNVHPHRLRKTVARLVALAIVGAPKVLMDLFGHKSIWMTLQYILSDPGIRAEIQAVAEAQVIMLAETAIEEAESNGGPAAVAIKAVVEAERIRMGSDYGATSVIELARIFTLDGKHWSLVRPGVLCTKLPGSSGPCNFSVGRPEPSRCRSRCTHRLEQALRKDDIDRTIPICLENYEREMENGNEIVAEYWAGQIVSDLPIFEDLRQKWLQHPAIAALLNRQAEGK